MESHHYSKNLKLTIVALLTLFCAQFTNAQPQSSEYLPGELIVQLEPGVTGEAFTAGFPNFPLTVRKNLSRRMNIWLMVFSPQEGETDDEILTAVLEHRDVAVAQFNHTIELRGGEPDDPFFGNQWALKNTGQSGGTVDADIDAVEAWDFAKGGVTATGEEIVIAVIDDGFDLQHEDLNFWKNVHEIPNNGIDDDNNGYIDDYDGWNAYASTGFLPVQPHGQHVSGIAGAIGNNGTGISGTNWAARILPVAGASGSEATVIEAYGYVLEMRERYDQTNGAEGAFIVSTNSSFGTAGSPAAFPIWCAMYDTFGVAGIISSIATVNANIDIDQFDDIPTSCPSDYMIAVTNTTRNDLKNTSPGAGFGLTTIDLGSPGTVILSTIPNNGYASSGWTGTSMATPHVAGSVALLFAAAPTAFIQQYRSTPSSSALMVKDMILNGTDPIAALQGISVTGGRLNAFNSILLMLSDDIDPRPVTQIEGFSDYQTPTSVMLQWTDPAELVNGNPIGGFAIRIYRDSVFVTEVSAGTQSYIDLGRTDGTLYRYHFETRLLASDSLSAATTTSVYAGGSPFPAAPKHLVCTGGSGSADLIWDKTRTQSDGTFLDDLAKYYIYRDGLLIDSTATGEDTTYTDIPPVFQQAYTYTVRAVDNETPVHHSAPSNSSSCFVGPPLSVDDNGKPIPDKLLLDQNYPNPFNPVTKISYGLPFDTDVTIVVYNVLGQKISTLVNQRQSAGSKTVVWDATDERGVAVGSGIYVYRLVAGGEVKSKKMVLVR